MVVNESTWRDPNKRDISFGLRPNLAAAGLYLERELERSIAVKTSGSS
jgi:hypothetical protein